MTDIVGISPTLAGLTLLIGKVWDAVTDPMVGHWSDRTITRMGRRRPFITAGSFSIVFFIFGMYTVPDYSAEIARFAHVTLFYLLASTSFTLMNIPYQAMLPELTSDFDERTGYIAYRMGFAIIGTLIGTATVTPLVSLIGKNGWSFTGGIIGLLATVTGLITVITVKEPKHTRQEEPLGFFPSLAHVLTRKPFLLALLPWAIFQLAVAMVQSTLLYYFQYIVGNADLFYLGVLTLLVAALVAIPLYVLLSRKIDKRGSYITGMGWMIVMLLLFTYLMPILPQWAGIVLMAVAGIGLGSHYVMPHSLLPDVIEWDAVTTGTRREGSFAAIWAFSGKIGQGLALWIGGLVLNLTGYTANQVQNPSAITGIKLLTGIFPAVIILVGILILVRYPITREFYDRMIHGASKGQADRNADGNTDNAAGNNGDSNPADRTAGNTDCDE